MEKYKGLIIEESLENNLILNEFVIKSVKITDDNNPKDRWHIYEVEIDKNQIVELSKHLKPQKWYAHFWNEKRDIIYRSR